MRSHGAPVSRSTLAWSFVWFVTFLQFPANFLPQGAYLLGLMPPELMKKLGIEIPTIRRDPHWFIPTTGTPVILALIYDD